MRNVDIYLTTTDHIPEFHKAMRDPQHPNFTDAMVASGAMIHGYSENLVYKHAISYQDEGTDTEIANRAFETFNIVSNAPARAYRARGNRSLSVGDVVVIDGQALACASFGWDDIGSFSNRVIGPISGPVV